MIFHSKVGESPSSNDQFLRVHKVIGIGSADPLLDQRLLFRLIPVQGKWTGEKLGHDGMVGN